VTANENKKMNLTTPALLFPAISLLLLAYTNRFMVLASLIRHLQGQAKEHRQDVFIRQMLNLRLRIRLIRNMQMLGVSSFILCAISMFLVFIAAIFIGQLIFGASLFLLVLSLILSLWEIAISTKAIEIALEDMQQKLAK
jgi:hypothetical protein